MNGIGNILVNTFKMQTEIRDCFKRMDKTEKKFERAHKYQTNVYYRNIMRSKNVRKQEILNSNEYNIKINKSEKRNAKQKTLLQQTLKEPIKIKSSKLDYSKTIVNKSDKSIAKAETEVTEHTYKNFITRSYYGERFSIEDQNKIVTLYLKNYEESKRPKIFGQPDYPTPSKVELSGFSKILIEVLLDKERRSLISPMHFKLILKEPLFVNRIARNIQGKFRSDTQHTIPQIETALKTFNWILFDNLLTQKITFDQARLRRLSGKQLTGVKKPRDKFY